MNTITKPRTNKKPKTKYKPPYAVIILNDDIHTFAYVIMCIQKVFGYSLEKASKLTEKVHEQGRAVVWTGQFEVAELKKEQIQTMGPDIHARVKCDFPLGVDLEPLP